ncbi:MAG TPA: FAD-binding oxidoreductase [Micromonosporaceae bacterium]
MTVQTSPPGTVSTEKLTGFAGKLITADHPEYEAARKVYNGMIDKRPAVIARCRGVADVVAAVRFARGEGLPIGVRGNGHSVAGHGTCDGGMLIDLRNFRSVQVDPQTRTAWVGGGATLGDVDRDTQLYGLALPTGQVSMTGIGGLTLNGGLGMLQRKYGLTCDNLIGAQMVTPDGDVINISETEHPDLLWALRGGGGNFGVVTSFKFQLHQVGPMMAAGLVAYPIDQAPEVLAFLRDFIADAPEELSADVIFQFAPPLDVIPEEYRGKQIAGIFVRWCGDPEEGMRVVRPIQEFGNPVLNFVAPMPLVTVQSLLDSLNPDGNLHYWTGEFLPRFDEREIDVVTEIGATLPSRFSIVQVIPFNGAPTRVPPDATAFAHRDDSWLIHVLCQWEEPEDTERCRAWAKDAGAKLRSIGSGDAYLNLLTDDEETDRIKAFWNDSRLSRLREVKTKYDPENVFRFNHNIKPDE